MTLEDKKNYVKRYIRLGMDRASAMMVAELTFEEMEELDKDEVFNRQLDFQAKLEEKALLEKFDTAMNATVAAYDTKDVRWKLSKLNPARWGEGQKAGKTNNPLNIKINMSGAKFDNGADNLEINTEFEPEEGLDDLAGPGEF